MVPPTDMAFSEDCHVEVSQHEGDFWCGDDIINKDGYALCQNESFFAYVDLRYLRTLSLAAKRCNEMRSMRPGFQISLICFRSGRTCELRFFASFGMTLEMRVERFSRKTRIDANFQVHIIFLE